MAARRGFVMADFSVDIVCEDGTTSFQPDRLNVPAGSLVSWNNTTSEEHIVMAPTQGTAAVPATPTAPAVPASANYVPAFETTLTFPGLSTTPEYYIPSSALADTEYPYSLDTGEIGTIVVVAVQDIPEI
jgi:plastocyanin